MTLAEYEQHPEDGRKIEFFDSEMGLAWMLRDRASPGHELPSRRLPQLVLEIALSRGSPIGCLGAAEVRLLDAEARRVRSMHPDEMVFLHAERMDSIGVSFLQVGQDVYPDVVLEVDHTTDVRRSKLALYEEWGFPEVWVDVPNAYSPSRPRRARPGLRIYRLEGAQYVEATESRAFPGWRAVEIHEALNERLPTAATSAVLARVGRALGEREGTTPDDNPLLRSHRAEARAEGRAEGRAEERVDLARALLAARGIPVPAAFPSPGERAVLTEASVGSILAAAGASRSVADFVSRLETPIA